MKALIKVTTLLAPEPINGLAANANMSKIAYGYGNSICIKDIFADNIEKTLTFDQPVKNISTSADGERIFWQQDDNIIGYTSFSDSHDTGQITSSEKIVNFTLSPDGQKIAVVTRNSIVQHDLTALTEECLLEFAADDSVPSNMAWYDTPQGHALYVWIDKVGHHILPGCVPKRLDAPGKILALFPTESGHGMLYHRYSAAMLSLPGKPLPGIAPLLPLVLIASACSHNGEFYCGAVVSKQTMVLFSRNGNWPTYQLLSENAKAIVTGACGQLIAIAGNKRIDLYLNHRLALDALFNSIGDDHFQSLLTLAEFGTTETIRYLYNTNVPHHLDQKVNALIAAIEDRQHLNQVQKLQHQTNHEIQVIQQEKQEKFQIIKSRNDDDITTIKNEMSRLQQRHDETIRKRERARIALGQAPPQRMMTNIFKDKCCQKIFEIDGQHSVLSIEIANKEEFLKQLQAKCNSVEAEISDLVETAASEHAAGNVPHSRELARSIRDKRERVQVIFANIEETRNIIQSGRVKQTELARQKDRLKDSLSALDESNVLLSSRTKTATPYQNKVIQEAGVSGLVEISKKLSNRNQAQMAAASLVALPDWEDDDIAAEMALIEKRASELTHTTRRKVGRKND